MRSPERRPRSNHSADSETARAPAARRALGTSSTLNYIQHRYSFAQAATKTVAAARSLYGGAVAAKVKAAFVARKILS